MAFQLPGTVQTNNPVLLHEWAGPFSGADETAALVAANDYIPYGVRLVGLEVTLIIGGVPFKYWYGAGTADADLVPMIPEVPLEVKDEGTVIDSSVVNLDFKGSSVRASGVSSRTVQVSIPDCTSTVKVGAVSGYFTSTNASLPSSLDSLHIGDRFLGWSKGTYNADCNSDSFGNIISIASEYRNCSIPLPIDLSSGDVVKICGNVILDDSDLDPFTGFPRDWNFYCSVSAIDCGTFKSDGVTTSASTIIPTITSPIQDGGENTYYACFSGSSTISTALSAASTSFVVGMNAGYLYAEQTTEYRFTYSLDVIKYCSNAKDNIVIRNCCEPLYTEIIAGNAADVGESFVDTDGNCWSVISTTLDPVTSIRTLQTVYSSCSLCIANNPCPLNYVVDACCLPGQQYFSASIPGISVGDSFVDNNGFCWSVSGTTPLPSTYAVSAVTVYPSDVCTTCQEDNPCPTLAFLTSCCDLGIGVSTLDLIGGGIADGDSFVDQFGFCWSVTTIGSMNAGDYVSLSFIHAVTVYASSSCITCLGSNTCPTNTLYYTIQNCCDESVEIALLDPTYSVNLVIFLESAQKAGCYRIISWSNTGTATITDVNVLSTYASDGKTKACTACLNVHPYCTGKAQNCTNYRSDKNDALMTGYGCDGTWYYNEPFAYNSTICMAWVSSSVTEFTVIDNNCCFEIFNPNIDPVNVSYNRCDDGNIINESIASGDKSTNCARELISSDLPVSIVSVGDPLCPDPR